MSKALYHLQTAFTSQVGTNNIGNNAGHLQERFCHEGQKGGLGSTQTSPGHQVELPDHIGGPLPLLHAPPLQYTQNPDDISSKDQDKEGLPRGRTHVCRHHQQTSYHHLQLAQGPGTLQKLIIREIGFSSLGNQELVVVVEVEDFDISLSRETLRRQGT